MRPMRIRAVAAGILIVLGAVLLPVGVLGFWADRTLVDTDTYVATVSPLSTDPAVQQAVATQVTDSLLDAASQNQVLGALLTAGGSTVNDAVEQLILRLVTSEQFAGVWDDVNRRVQLSTTAALAGHPDGPVTLEGDRLSVDTNVLLLALQDRLAEQLPAIGTIDLADAGRQVVVADSPAVGRAQTYYGWLTGLGPWLLPIAVLLLGIGIVLARRTARALLVVGVVCLLAAAVVALAILAGGRVADRALDGTALQPAASAVVSILTAGVRTYTWGLVGAGAALLIAGGALAAVRRGAVA